MTDAVMNTGRTEMTDEHLLDKHITAVARALREIQAVLEIHDIGAGTGPYEVREGDGGPLFTGTVEECADWIDKQYARAAILETLRQIREPAQGMTQAIGAHLMDKHDVEPWAAEGVWQAAIDHLIAEIADD